MEKFCKKYQIQKASHLFNLSNLNMIKGLQDYEKVKIEKYPVFNSIKADIQQVKDYMI